MKKAKGHARKTSTLSRNGKKVQNFTASQEKIETLNVFMPFSFCDCRFTVQGNLSLNVSSGFRHDHCFMFCFILSQQEPATLVSCVCVKVAFSLNLAVNNYSRLEKKLQKKQSV